MALNFATTEVKTRYFLIDDKTALLLRNRIDEVLVNDDTEDALVEIAMELREALTAFLNHGDNPTEQEVSDV